MSDYLTTERRWAGLVVAFVAGLVVCAVIIGMLWSGRGEGPGKLQLLLLWTFPVVVMVAAFLSLFGVAAIVFPAQRLFPVLAGRFNWRFFAAVAAIGAFWGCAAGALWLDSMLAVGGLMAAFALAQALAFWFINAMLPTSWRRNS